MEEINIKDFFSYLKHYILAFVIVTALAVGGVAIYDISFKKPIYQAKTTVVIAKSDATSENNSAATLNDINASQKLATTYSEIAKSELVLNQVIENLGLNTTVKQLSSNLTIKPVDDTAILGISARDPKPRLAAAIANEIASVFAKVVTEIYKVENVTQLSVATEPETPANNTLTRDLILATAISILVVTGFAFLRFYLDDTVKHGDDVEKTVGLPVTGRILRNDAKRGRAGSELIVESSPKAIVSENIKSLRTSLQFAAVDDDIKTILVTSTNASEGKSFVSANLAVSFAQAGKKVLIVDCDLRKGRLHKIFNVQNRYGFSDLLTSDLREIYTTPTKVAGLSIITCGTYPPNPSELLASKKNSRLVDLLSNRYDVVIFDGAPVGGLADSVILSSLMDETLIVVKDGSTSKADLIAAKDSLDKVGAKVAGIVFNMVNSRSSKYYYDRYYYGDSHKK